MARVPVPLTGTSVSVSQTSIIFATMIFGFFVYITCKGQLPAYLACFIGGSQNSPSVNSYNPANNPASMGSTPSVQNGLVPLMPLQPLTPQNQPNPLNIPALPNGNYFA